MYLDVPPVVATGLPTQVHRPPRAPRASPWLCCLAWRIGASGAVHRLCVSAGAHTWGRAGVGAPPAADGHQHPMGAQLQELIGYATHGSVMGMMDVAGDYGSPMDRFFGAHGPARL